MKNLLIIALCIFTVNIVFSQTKKEIKAEAAAKEYEKTIELIEGSIFEFVADWATSTGGKRINLITNPNYFKINKDSADIFLPYFGVGHSPSIGLTDNGGISFKGIMDKYSVKTNDKKQNISIKFTGKAQREQLDFTLTVYKSGSSFLNVNSNARSGIKYDGETKALEDKK